MGRALVLSGGGSKGAYQAGAIKHLLADLGVQYDIVCGVSVGALNAASLAMYSHGEEKAAVEDMLNIWFTISTPKVKKSWMPLGYFHALWKPSLYNSQPLIDFVRSRFSVEKLCSTGKKLSVGAVSLKTGRYHRFNENHPAIVDAVLASSAFPAMLCPIEIDGELWIDGGVRNVTPLKAAIDLGADAIDVIMTSPRHGVSEFPDKPNTIDVAARSIDFMSDEVVETDIRLAQLYNEILGLKQIPGKRKIDIRILRPANILGPASLEFDHDEIARMIDLGYNDAVSFYGDSP